MESGEVKLRLPAEPQLVSLARLTMAGLASRLGYDVEAAEDIRSAVAEAVTLLLLGLGPAAGGVVDLKAVWTDRELIVKVRRKGCEAGVADRDEAAIAQMVMEALMDKVEVAGFDSPEPRIALRKLRPGA